MIRNSRNQDGKNINDAQNEKQHGTGPLHRFLVENVGERLTRLYSMGSWPDGTACPSPAAMSARKLAQITWRWGRARSRARPSR